jgi:hypothetical protein
VKPFLAILFSALLVLVQIAPLPAATPVRPCCQQTITNQCAGCCGNGGCCQQSASDSKPVPAVPTQSRTQVPLAVLDFAVATLTLPENEPLSSAPVSISLLKAAHTPLYARNCVLLL